MSRYLKVLFFALIQFIYFISYGSPCVENYTIVNNKKINYIDSNCVKNGYWHQKYVNKEEIGYYLNGKENGEWKIIETDFKKIGSYKLGNKIGIWNIYSVYDNEKKIEEHYTNGILMKKFEFYKKSKYLTLNKTFISFIFEKYSSIIIYTMLLLFFIRVFLNNIILNKINNTNFRLFFKPFWNIQAKQDALECLIRFYWTKNDIKKQKKDLLTTKQMILCNYTFYVNAITFSIFTLNRIFESLMI